MARYLSLLIPLALVAGDLTAQGDSRSPAPPATPPSGWQWLFDSAPAEGWTFAEMPPGFHLTTTVASGLTLAVTGSEAPVRRNAATRVILFPPNSALDEGYGIALIDHRSSDEWLAFLVHRNGDVKVESRRAGRTTVLEPRRKVTAVVVPDTTGYADNRLAIEADGTWITFLVNDSVAAQVPRSAAPARIEAGLRIGAGLNMHLISFDLITPMASSRPRELTASGGQR